MADVLGFTAGYRNQSGLDELRVEAYPFVAASAVIGIWFVDIANLPNLSPISVAIPLGLAVFGAVGYRLLASNIRLASGLLVAGLVLAATMAIWIYPGTLLACLLAPVVLVAGLLLGPVGGIVVAILGTGSISLADHLGQNVIPHTAAIMAIALIWATALLSWLTSRSLYTALDWSWHSYVQMLDKVQKLQQQQGQLNRVLKSLNDAYYRLEQVNAELERARAAAQEARQLKAEFVATISHELRTPLNLIIGFSEMMATAPHTYASEALPPDYQCDIDAIYRNSQHLSSLIDDILDLGQIEAGRMALSREPSQLEEVVEGAVSAVRGLFDGKGIDLRIEIADNLPVLFIDPTRVRQVLINLLNNAARFTERGSVTVTARAAERDVIVAVTDTGPGIALKDLQSVFEEFRQVDGSIRRRYGGSGLGLAICKNFVELHGGSIWVESTLGVGSTFTFSLPIQGNVIATPSRNDWETWVRPGVGQRQSKEILAIVDPGGVGRKVFRRPIEGWQTVVVGSYAELCRLLRAVPEGTVKLVVGLAPARTIQIQDQIAELPVSVPVITCSVASDGDRLSALRVVDRLHKPILSDQVAAVLSRLPPVQEVLIVDDDPEMVRLLARMVRSASRRARILGAYDGAGAIALAQQRQPDVIFLDLAMPGLDGHSVLERLRADERFQDTPVVVTTGIVENDAMSIANINLSRSGGLGVAEFVRCVQFCLTTFSRRASRSDVTPRGVIAD